MKHARMPRPRLTAAIAATLAVGAMTSTASAVADPVAEAAVPDATAQAESAVLSVEPGSEIISAGTTGFLTSDGDADVRWTRYADGTSTVLGRDLAQAERTEWHGAMSDTVVMPKSNWEDGHDYAAELFDMASGAARVEIDLRTLGRGYKYIGAVGSTVLAKTVTGTAEQIHLVTKDGASLSNRSVTGLPADAQAISTAASTEGSVLLRYRTGPDADHGHLALVDLATATVTETHSVGTYGSAAVSSSHIAWFEPSPTNSDTTVLNVAERGGGEPRRITLTDLYQPVVGLVGGWVTYGSAYPLTWGAEETRLALTAEPLAGGPPRKLLEHLTTLVPAPDGSLLAMGGTLEDGEGVYRIAPGTDGAPAATLVASTGEPTGLTYLGHTVPSVIDLDKNRGRISVAWRLSRLNIDMKVTLRHVRTGLTQEAYLYPGNGPHPNPQQTGFTWGGSLNDNGRWVNAPNGDYTWHIHATPTNGIGPAVTASGTFKVVRKAAPHDYSDNGSPDLLARDSSGRLWRQDTASYPDDSSYLGEGREKLVGSGWQIYNRIEAAGNVGGSAVGDLVARDSAGVLWLYQGRGDGTFATRTRIGSGWQIYRHLAGGSDLTGDGRADLVATDSAGALWLYKGTGDARSPFATRKKIGLSGWQQFNRITATGDISGTAAGDLVARDTAGVLWLYQGRGDGTFTTRVKIGGGWNTYTHIVGIGDGNRDGRPDLYASAPDGETYFYQGTGNASAPFRARQGTPVLFGSAPSYNHIA